MKNKRIQKTLIATAAIMSMVLSPANAGWLPKPIEDLISDNPLAVAENRVRVFFILMIGALLLVVVYTIIQKLMQFSRDDTEIKDATKIMQKQLVVVGGVFVSIMGLALVFVFFGQRIFTINKICIDAPDSIGCFSCDRVEEDDDLFDQMCSVCNEKPDLEFTDWIKVPPPPGGDALLFTCRDSMENTYPNAFNAAGVEAPLDMGKLSAKETENLLNGDPVGGETYVGASSTDFDAYL